MVHSLFQTNIRKPQSKSRSESCIYEL